VGLRAPGFSTVSMSACDTEGAGPLTDRLRCRRGWRDRRASLALSWSGLQGGMEDSFPAEQACIRRHRAVAACRRRLKLQLMLRALAREAAEQSAVLQRHVHHRPGEVGAKAQGGQTASECTPIWDVGSSSTFSISAMVDRAAMLVRSGPLTGAAAWIIWQLEQRPSPKKIVRRPPAFLAATLARADGSWNESIPPAGHIACRHDEKAACRPRCLLE